MSSDQVCQPCATLIAARIRAIDSNDAVQWIAHAMQAEGDKPRTNGELVERIFRLFADTVEMLPHESEQP